MKTVFYGRNGPADSVLEFGSKPTPAPDEGEVLVRLATSGVNPSDVKSRAGREPAFDFVVPHSDGAGVVEAVGEGVDQSLIGTRVWIWNGQWQRQLGTAAEFIAVPQFQAVPLDSDVSFETAACFGIPGLTAAHVANLLESISAETVLVTGAGNAVGHIVTQMAVLMGRKVIGTASAEKQQSVEEAGAIATIDYRTEDVAARVVELTQGKGVDAIIDMDFYSSSQLIGTDALKPKGTLLCYGSNDMGAIDVPFRELLFKSITLQFFLVYELDAAERRGAIDRLNHFMSSGQAQVRVSHVLAFDEIVKAHELVESGQANGNVVLRI
ncbi:MAG: NADPH:quinone reductase [Pseudomonadota bacterium]